jgi:hypothetical protein
VRDYWGHFIKCFWENCHASEGCLGGAIWAGFDEVFLLPDGPVGYGHWGIVDGWRRAKPEYWHTLKAYSPVRIAESDVPNPGVGQPLEIAVKNWFNHTHFSEIQVTARVGATELGPRLADAAPGADAKLLIPGRDWQDGDVLDLEFYGGGGIRVDLFRITIGKRVVTFPAAKGPAPRVIEDTQTLTVQGGDFRIVFSKSTGLITEGEYRDKRILNGGPLLILGGTDLAPWWLGSLRHSSTPDEVVINLTGAHVARQGSAPRISSALEIRIDGQGLITTEYTILDPVKGANEVGLAFVLSPSIDRLAWDRKSLWTVYPPDHIGRPQGMAKRAGPWSSDTRDFFLFGPNDPGDRGTNDFRSRKENIRWAACGLADTPLQVRAESDGTAAARVEVRSDGKVQFNIDHLWAYTDLAFGETMPPIDLEGGYKNTVRLRLTDESIS